MINTKDDASLSQASSLINRTTRRVVLLDGRIVEAELGVNLPLIDRDGISTPIAFGLFVDYFLPTSWFELQNHNHTFYKNLLDFHKECVLQVCEVLQLSISFLL